MANIQAVPTPKPKINTQDRSLFFPSPPELSQFSKEGSPKANRLEELLAKGGIIDRIKNYKKGQSLQKQIHKANGPVIDKIIDAVRN